ncbi:MAG: hypothetical protein E4G89_02625 [Methanothrix sp.]|nr:MAG: hypothetical protein E4G89_02625 [Methanothrix sp.]
MHRTSAGDRRQALKKTARELSRDARALQKAARAPAARREAERLQGEADAGQICVMPFLAYQKGNSYLSRT